MADVNIGGTLHCTATGNVGMRANEVLDTTKNKKQDVINAETDATLAQHTSAIQGLNSQNYETYAATNQTTAVTDVLPATGSVDTVYRLGNWDGSQFDETSYSEYSWNGSAYVHISTKPQIGEVFDISAYHATGGTLATYDDLNDALNGTNGGVPQSLQKGGMSVKFVQSSDNKYVQYRYMGTATTGNPNPFLDTANWEADNRSTGIIEGVYTSEDEFINIESNNGDILVEADLNCIKIHKPLILENDINVENELKKIEYIEEEDIHSEPVESIILETDNGVQCSEITVKDEHDFDGESDYLESIEFGDTLAITANYTEAKKPIRTNGIHCWVQKLWATVGDSLVEYNSRSSKFVQQYIHDYTGINVQNVGHSGWGFVAGGYLAEINSITGTPDVITIQSSGNDMHYLRDGLPLGNITDNTTASYCGYINIVLDRVFELFPTVPLGCITSPPWRTGYPGGEDKLFENMCNAFLEICYNRGIPTLDLFHISNLHPEDIHYRTLVYDNDTTCKITTSDDPTAILVTPENIDDLQVLSDDVLHVGDYVTNAGGVHPNEIGHALMAPRVKSFLTTLITF